MLAVQLRLLTSTAAFFLFFEQIVEGTGGLEGFPIAFLGWSIANTPYHLNYSTEQWFANWNGNFSGQIYFHTV